jgi:hypothetical protein
MGFLNEMGGAASHILNPANFGKIFGEGLSEIEHPVRKVLSGEAFKSLSSLGEAGLMLPLQTALGGAMLYPAVKWDRPDLDEAGPFESMMDRGSGLYAASAAFAPSIFEGRRLLPGIAGIMAAEPILNRAGKYLGRGLDWATGNRPDPNQLNQRFMDRVSPRAKELTANGQDENSAMQNASMELLQQYPSYLDWAK